MDSELSISRILHAGYLFECKGTKILMDPIFENPFSRNCYAYPSVEFNLDEIKKLKVDAVFISHYHDDHCSLESLVLLDKQTPIYLYCQYPELHQMIREIGFQEVYELEINQCRVVGPFEIVTRRALDFEIDSLFHIKAAGLNILNVVDSWIDEETFELLLQTKSWDLVLWPFQTMRELEVLSPSRLGPKPVQIPVEWLRQIEKLKPRFLVPSSCQFRFESWSWHNHAYFPISYDFFDQTIKELVPEIQVLRLNPSLTIKLDTHHMEFSKRLNFVIPIGEQELDYHFKENFPAPKTSEVAKFLPALSLDECQLVHNFCVRGIIEKYQELEGLDEPFFTKSRHWRLSLFTHLGNAENFYYQIDQSKLILLNERPENICWSTELPLTKLFSALTTGESLSSLYVRINDEEFSSQIELELKDVDILYDPLLFCLFSSEVGSYQKAQLKKINSSKTS
jgi:hypothetical protein